MDDIRLARVGRHLRQRFGWRQRDLGDRIGLSQGGISLFERGLIDGMPVATVRKILGGLDAELVLYVRWRGGDLDRLLDAGHSRLCNDIAGIGRDPHGLPTRTGSTNGGRMGDTRREQ
jgi:transcriptional regulator with XRE-family HTH domain